MRAQVRERFASLNVEPGGGTPRDFGNCVGEEIAKYDALVKRLAIKAE